MKEVKVKIVNVVSKFIILVFFISIAFYSCSNEKSNSTLTLRKTKVNIGKIQQRKSDLLAGVSNAVCYSGYRKGQHPDRGNGAVNPSNGETLEDLKILSDNSNFKLIRLYDSGENSETVLQVIKENNIKIKVMLGIWLKAELSNHEGCPWITKEIPKDILEKNRVLNLNELNRGIKLANKYSDIIVAVNVGNEALVKWNDHLVDEEVIINYVKFVKAAIKQPVTVADNYKWWSTSGKELAKIVDFASIHVYPLWEGQDIENGLSYSISNIDEVCKAIPKSKIVITEVGWATKASEFGERASEEKQALYYNKIMSWAKKMNITTFFFEAFDEPWKGDPENIMGAEKHWGLFNVDRTPKLVMKKKYSK